MPFWTFKVTLRGRYWHYPFQTETQRFKWDKWLHKATPLASSDVKDWTRVLWCQASRGTRSWTGRTDSHQEGWKMVCSPSFSCCQIILSFRIQLQTLPVLHTHNSDPGGLRQEAPSESTLSRWPHWGALRARCRSELGERASQPGQSSPAFMSPDRFVPQTPKNNRWSRSAPLVFLSHGLWLCVYVFIRKLTVLYYIHTCSPE